MRFQHRSEQKLRDFAHTTLEMYICIREYSNQAKFNTLLWNHLSEIGPVENDLKEMLNLAWFEYSCMQTQAPKVVGAKSRNFLFATLDSRARMGVGPARGKWINLGRLPLRVFSIGKNAFQKNSRARNPRFLMPLFGQKTGVRAHMINEIKSRIPCSVRFYHLL